MIVFSGKANSAFWVETDRIFLLWGDRPLDGYMAQDSLYIGHRILKFIYPLF